MPKNCTNQNYFASKVRGQLLLLYFNTSLKLQLRECSTGISTDRPMEQNWEY